MSSFNNKMLLMLNSDLCRRILVSASRLRMVGVISNDNIIYNNKIFYSFYDLYENFFTKKITCRFIYKTGIFHVTISLEEV